jgi:hypothetical protein
MAECSNDFNRARQLFHFLQETRAPEHVPPPHGPPDFGNVFFAGPRHCAANQTMSYKPAPSTGITLWTIKRDLINQYVLPSLGSAVP